MNCDVHVFHEKDRELKEVQDQNEWWAEESNFCFVDNPLPLREQGRDDQPANEQEAPAMEEFQTEDVQSERMMWMSERFESIQNENEELMKTVQEMTEDRTPSKHNRELGERFGEMQKSNAEIA